MHRLFFVIGLFLLAQGCYSFRAATIDARIQSYFIHSFESNAVDALPGLEQRLTGDLQDKIRLNSRLQYQEINPDIEFKGILAGYQISAEAPSTGERVAINRLTITLAIEYIDNITDAEPWKRNFSFFYDYPSGTDFSSIEEEAITTISDQLMEDIFNASFSNW
ncbi:MAG: hypothetical protein HRU40_14520 [Saprospiraceae bacterium]|nr:hypothetical protein [Saprospiraceae bacterium]